MLNLLASKSLKSLAPYIVMGVLAALCFWLWNSNQKLNREIGSVRVQLSQAVLTNETNQNSITELDNLLHTCNEKFDQSVSNNKIAIKQLTSDYENLKKQKDRVHVELKEIFKTPSCEELGNIDINSSCPALANELRSIADSIDQD